MDPQGARCPHCGEEITAAQAATLGQCGAPICAAARSRVLAGEAREARLRESGVARARAEAELGARLDEIARAEGVAPEAVLVGPVPHRVPVLVPADPGRRAAFLAHVARLCEEAFAVPEEEIGAVYDRAAADAAEPAVAGPACASCRGRCCIRGGSQNAFVKLGTIQGFRRAEPGLTAERILSRYEAHFPEESSAGGCVFQGPMGCSLPRHFRARICNSFHCEALEALIEEAAGAVGPVVVAASDEAGVQVVSVMAPDGSWREVAAGDG